MEGNLMKEDAVEDGSSSGQSGWPVKAFIFMSESSVGSRKSDDCGTVGDECECCQSPILQQFVTQNDNQKTQDQAAIGHSTKNFVEASGVSMMETDPQDPFERSLQLLKGESARENFNFQNDFSANPKADVVIPKPPPFPPSFKATAGKVLSFQQAIRTLKTTNSDSDEDLEPSFQQMIRSLQGRIKNRRLESYRRLNPIDPLPQLPPELPQEEDKKLESLLDCIDGIPAGMTIQNVSSITPPACPTTPPPPPPPPPPLTSFKQLASFVMKKTKQNELQQLKERFFTTRANVKEMSEKENIAEASKPPVDLNGISSVAFSETPVALEVRNAISEPDTLKEMPPGTFDGASKEDSPNFQNQVENGTKLAREIFPSATISTSTRDVSHFAKAGEFLCRLYEHDQLTDVIVQCGNCTFTAHAVVLACHSPFFARALLHTTTCTNDRSKVSLAADVSPTAFQVLLDYMYTGELQINSESVAELLSASLTLNMTQVEGQCRDLLHTMSPEAVLVVWEMAERNLLQDVAKKALELLGKDFTAVIQTPAFLELNLKYVIQLLSSDDLPVTSEMQVADAAVSWLRYREFQRCPFTSVVIGCVRLGLLSAGELFQIKNMAEFIFKDEKVQNMFLEANWLATSKSLGASSGFHIPVPRVRTAKKTEKARRGKRPATSTVETQARNTYVSIDSKSQEPTKQKDTEQASELPYSSHILPPSNSGPPFPLHQVCFIDPTLEYEECADSSSNESSGSLPVVTNTSLQYSEENSSPSVRVTRLLLLGGYDPMSAAETRQKADGSLSYNRAAHMWMSHLDLPAPSVHHACVVFTDTVYIIGGSNPECQTIVGLPPRDCVYALPLSDGKWRQVAPLIQARTRLGACVLGGKIYAIGGRHEKGVLSSVEVYDIERDKWGTVASLNCGRLGAGVATHYDCIMVAGGYGQARPTEEFTILASVECYDPKADCWTFATNLRVPRCHASLVCVGGRLFLCGGLSCISQDEDMVNATSLSAIDVYDESLDTWRLHTDLSVPRHQVTSAVLDGKLYVVSGVSSLTKEAMTTMECYDVISGTWERDVKDLPRPLVGGTLVTATLLF